ILPLTVHIGAAFELFAARAGSVPWRLCGEVAVTMKRQLFRMVRWASVVFPVMWFLYVLHTVSQGEDDSSLFPREVVPQREYDDAVADLSAQESENLVPKEKKIENHPFPTYKDPNPADSNIANYKEDADKVLRNFPDVQENRDFKGKLKNQGIDFQRNENVNNKGNFSDNVLRVPPGPRNDVNDKVPADVRKNNDDVGDQKDADPYADVTYPSYVERLPSGAKGQGEKGLKIKKDDLPPDQQKVYQEKWDKNSFNQMASDLIPVHRELPDFRSQQCREKQYPSTLPSVSVIIIFHNEAWSTLLRSVHSILDRTRDDLLTEVILVDDSSTMDHLKKPLEKYFRDYPKVKIVRSPERGGLTKARLRGFAESKGEAIVFLDSHIECSPGWAEPLLAVIAEDYRAVPFPIIDMIGAGDLGYMAHGMSALGTFNFQSLTFTWSNSNLYVLDHVKTPANTRPSPTMPGGLFAISRRWFIELGLYDPELDYWGGENMELSFKAWMCNGSVVVAECSHIGHIFRSTNPIKWATNLGNRNYVRVAMVWMDQYKNHYFERVNYNLGDYGDISERLALRKRLGCHDFGWYMDNIYPELKKQIVMNATYAGQVKHKDTGLCLDKMSNHESGPQLFSCHSLGGPQFWYLADDKYLQIESRFAYKGPNNKVKLSRDHHDEWRYDEKTEHLQHVESGLCMQKSADSPRTLVLAPCSPLSFNQRWLLQRRRPFPDSVQFGVSSAYIQMMARLEQVSYDNGAFVTDKVDSEDVELREARTAGLNPDSFGYLIGRAADRKSHRRTRLTEVVPGSNTILDNDGGARHPFSLGVFTSKKQGSKIQHKLRRIRSYYRAQDELIAAYEGISNDDNCDESKDDAMKKRQRLVVRLSQITFFVNLLAASVLSGSLAIISSLVDSVVDLVSGLLLWWTNRAIRKSDPYVYPQGRSKLEPVSIIVLSVVMGVASLQLIREAIEMLVDLAGDSSSLPSMGIPTFVIAGCTIVAKLVLWLVCRRVDSPTVQALALDHRNDVMSNIVAIACGYLGSAEFQQQVDIRGFIFVDPAGAILISVYIIYNWWRTGHEQMKLLTGHTARPDFLSKITWLVLNHDHRIRHVDTVRAFHFGNNFLVEVDIVLPGSMDLCSAHEIGETLQQKLENMDEVERAFVHVDYEWTHNPEAEHKVVR
ncbi:hypothetical protein BaRGS_00004578, partial [Batillaria attramentaria]